MTDDDEMFTFSYGPETFPFHSDRYTWPRVAVYDEDGATELDIHCIRDTARRRVTLMGFIGVDPETQISCVIFMAQKYGADTQVITFKGVGLDDGIVNALMANMIKMSEDATNPDGQISMMHTYWPTRFQYKILREAMDMCRHGDFHEESLAYRMKAPVEEIRQHLELLADLGLMEAK
jgi:hypothetical protein